MIKKISFYKIGLSTLLFSSLFFIFNLFNVLAQDNLKNRYRGFTVHKDITSEDIEFLANEWGVRSVRYSLEWNLNADNASITEYNEWLEKALNDFSIKNEYFRNQNIKVILQLYTPPGGFVSHSEFSQHRIFTSEEFKNEYFNVWQKISQLFANDTNIIAFQLLNEPAVGSDNNQEKINKWLEIIPQLIQIIRNNSNKTIIIDPIYSNPSFVNKLDSIFLNKNINTNIALGFNMYFPFDFINQGRIGFPKRVAYPNQQGNAKNVKRYLSKVKRFSKKHQITVFVGEFTTVRWAKDKDVVNYFKDVLSNFEKNKWNWNYHTFRESDVWDLELTNKKKSLEKRKKRSPRLKLLLRYIKRSFKNS